jgi:hypothetical protein
LNTLTAKGLPRGLLEQGIHIETTRYP